MQYQYQECTGCGQSMMLPIGSTDRACPVCDKVAAETARCVQIIRDNMWSDSGSTPVSRQMNTLLAQIISEIKGTS